MDDRIQYKMFNLEVTPPDNAWDNIESILNNEQEVSLIQRFKDFEVTPPLNIWSSLEAELDGRVVRPAPVFRINFRRLATASVIIGIISGVGWLMTSGKRDYAIPAGAATAALVPPTAPAPKPFVPANPNASPASRVERITASAPALNLSRRNHEAPLNRTVVQANPGKPLRAGSVSMNQINVNAPLILGHDGKPYIDYQLLSGADKRYITITSPNGEQTRISAKFLPVLTYLNDHSAGTADAGEWVARFQQWKKRLLEDPDFIPAAGNFLDLPELTEVFQEQ